MIREWLARCPLIAILRGIETHEIEDVFSALSAAGVVIAEIPLNSPDPFKSLARAAKLFGDRMLVGAGTVTRVAHVEQVCLAGGRLIVCPHADAEIVREARRHKLIVIPGIGTATEAFAMVHAGADALKLFPADVLGTRMMTGLRAVLPKATMMIPVGGVDAETIPVWRSAGAEGYGVGSALYKPGRTGAQVADLAASLIASLTKE